MVMGVKWVRWCAVNVEENGIAAAAAAVAAAAAAAAVGGEVGDVNIYHLLQ